MEMPNFEEHMSVAISRWSEFNQKQYHGEKIVNLN